LVLSIKMRLASDCSYDSK